MLLIIVVVVKYFCFAVIAVVILLSSYLVAGAQQRELPAPPGQLSERCSPHREHSARLQPRRLGRADKHSCQV